MRTLRTKRSDSNNNSNYYSNNKALIKLLQVFSTVPY